MKKRAKPKENWENVVEVPRDLFKKEDYQEILQKLDILFNDQIIKKIITAQIHYYTSMMIINERPRMTEVCAAMKRLIKYGKLYQECLRKMDDKSREKMAVVIETPFEFWNILDRNLSDTTIVTGRAKGVLEDWKYFKKSHKIGAPLDWSLRSYICELAEIYRETTGKKAGFTRGAYSKKDKKEEFNSPFMRFISYCFKKVPGHPRLTNDAFASSIERAMKNPITTHSSL
ncbi:MAG: hypothetical protein FJ130_04195 [Deltaproteobacteria bacterium]|nr:hypothetical protein [Deltaproteobacteria bacterium]